MTSSNHHLHNHYHRFASPDDSLPALSSVPNASHLDFAGDHDFARPTLSLGYVTDHSTLDPSIASFVHVPASSGPSLDSIDDVDLSPYPSLGVTPTLPADAFRQTELTRLSLTPSPGQDVSNLPQAEPWSSFAIAGRPVTDRSDPPDTPLKHLRPQRLDDSGYEGSQQSSSLMKGHAHTAAPRGPHYLDTESLETRFRQTFPDKQLPAPAPVPIPPISRPGPRTAETSRSGLDFATNFQCDECALPFTTHSEYQKHMARHEKRWVCTVPGCTRQQGFATSNDLERHNKGVHKRVGLDDAVWKCLVDGCRSAEKIWTRLDNFIAHIKRMHKHADADEYVRLSEQWLEEVEKPRRQQEWVNQGTLGHMVGTDPHAYAGADAELTYEPSQADLDDYAMSVAGGGGGGGDYGDGGPATKWDTAVAAMNPYADPMDAFEHPTIPSTQDLTRSYSNNPNMSLSSAHDPTLPLPFRQDDFMASFHAASHPGTPAYLNIVMKSQTLPDLHRATDQLLPDWQSTHFPDTSPTLAAAAAADPQPDPGALLYMGGEHHLTPTPAPAINFQDADVFSPSTPSGGDRGGTPAGPTAEQITARNARDHQRDIAQLLHQFTRDPQLIKRLSESIHKTLKEYSSSNSLQVDPSSGEGPRGRGAKPETPFPCTRAGCTKRFAKKNRLKKHEKRHDRVFFCTFDDCYKRFGTKTDLARHEYRVHDQGRCWRCWSSKRHRGRNLACAQLFTDEAEFEAHRKTCHSKGKRTVDDFKVERDFAGSFWCGFCNEVISNPEPIEVSGHARVNFRYQHIENHMNDIYLKSPGRNAMHDWRELGGGGKTKAEAKNAAKPAEQDLAEDDDSDDEDDGDEAAPIRAGSMSASGSATASGAGRTRSLTNPNAPQYSQYLRPQDIPRPHPSLKRSHAFLTPELPVARPSKVPRLTASVSGPNAPPRPRQLSIGSVNGPAAQPFTTATTTGTPQTLPILRQVDIANAHSVVSYIRCCHCKLTPQHAGPGWTCVTCWQRYCEHCQYYDRDQKQLRVGFDGRRSGAYPPTNLEP